MPDAIVSEFEIPGMIASRQMVVFRSFFCRNSAAALSIFAFMEILRLPEFRLIYMRTAI